MVAVCLLLMGVVRIREPSQDCLQKFIARYRQPAVQMCTLCNIIFHVGIVTEPRGKLYFCSFEVEIIAIIYDLTAVDKM